MAEATKFADRLRNRINNLTILYDTKSLKVSISIGVGEISEDDADFDSMLLRADHALYEAKASGRNRTSSGIHGIIRRHEATHES
jgi:diguanylate cyclase (GGDEF)-like protein